LLASLVTFAKGFAMSRWTRRTVGAVALAALAVVFLGCMNLSIAERTPLSPGCHTEGEILCQEGKVTLRPKERRKTPYPLPYESVPNLELEGDDSVSLEDQAKAYFVLENTDSFFARSVTWKARGQRQATAPPTPPDAVPPSDLPERPVPIEKPNG
jgi:hypothetical protein